MADFDRAMTKMLAHEGGSTFSNDSNNRGGATRYGISQKAYPDIDIQNLTKQKARDIYRRDYWSRVRADGINSQEIAENIFHTCVNVNVGVGGGSKLAHTC
jgi:lysozyme family protein